MAVDMFLRVEGIQGESKDSKHADQIQVLSWSWDVAQKGTAGSGTGLTAGSVEHRDIVIRKLVDKSSPVLYQFCCNGEHIPSADLYVRKAGGKAGALEYVVIHLEELIITGFSLGGQPQADQIEEEVKINYAKVKITYTPQDNAGQGLPPVLAGWNLQENIPI
jgi:type VI secretion system secreted protein Hcp